MTINKKGDDVELSWTGSVNLSTGTTTTSNLAKIFSPNKPMNEPGVDALEFQVWQDVPEELNRVLREGMKKISTDCLKENGKIVLNLFQEIILWSSIFVCAWYYDTQRTQTQTRKRTKFCGHPSWWSGQSLQTGETTGWPTGNPM